MIQRQDKFTGLPFYIFLTILLGGFGAIGAFTLWQTNQPVLAALNGLLLAAHIALHWLNLKQFDGRRWWLFYHLTQTGLIIMLTIFPYESEAPIGLNFLGSAVISMVGEGLGMWGNTRRALWLGLFYLSLLIALFVILVESVLVFSYLTGLFINGGFIVLVMVLFNQQLKQRQKAVALAETLESANAKLVDYASQIETLTLTAERQRMARELHDTLAQGVAGLVLQLEAIKAHLGASNSERAAEIVVQSLSRARSTLADSRAAIDDLRAVPASLPEAVRTKVERFRQATGIPCELALELGEDNGRLPSTSTIQHALRILSEALANITRHAQATQVKVCFFVENERLELEIEDNGQGFDPETVSHAGHYGLLGMQERARLTGGTLAIDSAPERGTRIHLQIPITVEEEIL